MILVTRHAMLTGALAAGLSLSLAACVSTNPSPIVEANAPTPSAPPISAGSTPQYSADVSPEYAAMYGPVTDEPYPIAGVDLTQVNHDFLRKEVDYKTDQPPGTIIVDPDHHYLYHVLPGGRAMRYGVGVGREGFGWSGVATIHNKQEWPDWYPPPEMFARQPDIKPYMSQLQSGLGMPGGADNPLGARAMYLWEDNKDTLFRIHGTNEPWTIGTSVSSGCIRMINQDVIDLYSQTPAGTKVIVLGPGVTASLGGSKRSG